MYREVAQWRHIRRPQKRPLKLRAEQQGSAGGFVLAWWRAHSQRTVHRQQSARPKLGSIRKGRHRMSLT